MAEPEEAAVDRCHACGEPLNDDGECSKVASAVEDIMEMV